MFLAEEMLSKILGTGSIQELSNKTKEELSSMLSEIKEIKSNTERVIGWLENKISEKSNEEQCTQ